MYVDLNAQDSYVSGFFIVKLDAAIKQIGNNFGYLHGWHSSKEMS